MPKAYEQMRDKFISGGMSSKAAKGKAARIYNSKHPGAPVTGKHKSKGRKKRKPMSSKMGGYTAA